MPWPYLANGINPAQYRYDRNHGYYQNDPPTNEIVYTGWDSYENVCGPPKYSFTDGSVINNLQKEYIAMENIIAGPFSLGTGNTIVFKAENGINLKPGFHVTPNNNYFKAMVGSVCENNNSIDFSYKDSYNLQIDTFFFDKSIMINLQTEIYNKCLLNDSCNNSDELKDVIIYPNPSKGYLNIRFKSISDLPINIKIIDSGGVQIFDRTIFDRNEFQLSLMEIPNGIYFIYIIDSNTIYYKKVILLK